MKEYADGSPLASIDRDILEKFLILIRDRHPVADKANYFLERNGISGLSIAITNQRDVLSHLRTCLDPGFTRDQKLAQLATAEEHLRRAIIEPYQVACGMKKQEVKNLLVAYEKAVLSRMTDPKFSLLLGSAPNKVAVNAAVDEIEEMLLLGREGKSRNLWDERWEDGYRSYLAAFQAISKLQKDLEDYIHRSEQIKDSKKQIRLALIGIGLAVVTFVLGILVSRYFSNS